MKYKTITVSFGATIGTGNYTNIRPEVTLEAELDDNDLANGIEFITSKMLYDARWQVATNLSPYITRAFENDISWYASIEDEERLQQVLVNRIDAYRWLTENEATYAGDLFMGILAKCKNYRNQHPTQVETVAPDGVSDIPF